METKDLLKKMNEIGDAIQLVQTKNDELEGKVNAIDLEQMQKATDDAIKKLEEIQDSKIKENAEAQIKRIEDLELELAKQNGGGKSEDESEYKNALALYMRKGAHPGEEAMQAVCLNAAKKSLIGVDDADIEKYAKDLLVGSGPDGGYLVTSDRSEMMSRRIFETSPLRSVANVVTTSSDVFEMILDDDEADCGWVGEVESRSDTDTPQIGLIKIPVHEVYAQPRATQKMLDDVGFDIEGWLGNKVSSRIGRKENTSFVVGDGSQKPKGFLQYDPWAVAGTYERNKVEQRTATGTAGTLDNADDLIDLQTDLLEEYQGDAQWGMRRKTFGEVMKLKDSQGAYLINPMIIKEGTSKILLGADVIFMSDMPAVATDALAVAYANWNEFYTIVDRFGIRVLRDPYTAKPYTRFYTTKRVGGAVTNFQAGKLLKIN